MFHELMLIAARLRAGQLSKDFYDDPAKSSFISAAFYAVDGAVVLVVRFAGIRVTSQEPAREIYVAEGKQSPVEGRSTRCAARTYVSRIPRIRLNRIQTNRTTL